jgi:hypothetical protein
MEDGFQTGHHHHLRVRSDKTINDVYNLAGQLAETVDNGGGVAEHCNTRQLLCGDGLAHAEEASMPASMLVLPIRVSCT